MADRSTSGVDFLKFAASGRNRFVTGIALLAALSGFLFGYDTGIISGRSASPDSCTSWARSRPRSPRT